MHTSKPLLLFIAFAISGYLLVNQISPVADAQEAPPLVSQEQFERWQEEISNWGRWGPDDEIGTLNLITPAKRKEAASLVMSGVTVSLARTADTVESVDNTCPVEWEMVNASPRGASDRVAYRCIHGTGTTHIDGFGHRFFDGKMWNGVEMADTVTMEEGVKVNSVLTMKDGIVTRGVLYDIPKLKGVDYLEAGYRITIADLEAWEAQTGVKVGPGDAMLLRWGRCDHSPRCPRLWKGKPSIACRSGGVVMRAGRLISTGALAAAR